MTTFEYFSLQNIAPVAWKNGGGTTREIACSPLGATMADFDWRLSVADVTRDGAFSVFPNIDRSITLLEGKGMQLRDPVGNLIHALTKANVPFSFAGEAPIVAHLVHGATSDFNVMTRRGAYRATVESIAEIRSIEIPENGMLLITRGQCTFRDEKFYKGEGCVWRNAPVQSAQRVCDLTQGGHALFVSIHRTIVG